MLYLIKLIILGLIIITSPFTLPKLFKFLIKLIQFSIFVYGDIKKALREKKIRFKEYGLTLYCGRQGAGKTVAMVDYLERMRKKYPKLIIITNFGYKHQTFPFTDWEQLLTIKNGEDGVIFAIDEIQSEWSSSDWKDFSEDLLRQVTQQRKQRIKIVGTSQRFNRVVIQLREQTFEVVECKTLLGRWTFTKAFDADEYNEYIDRPEKKNRLSRLYRHSFIQFDDIRNSFDTYQVIEKMENKYKSKKSVKT